MLHKQSLSRVGTGQLNKMLQAAMEYNPPSDSPGQRPKIYYATQVASQPPTIVLFCNEPKSVPANYQRYLLGVFREKSDFGEVPIKLYLRRRDRGDQRGDDATG
jgi:GTP-binding protein